MRRLPIKFVGNKELQPDGSWLLSQTTRRALNGLLANNPTARRVVRQSALRMTIQRALLKVLAQRQGKKGPRSIVLKSMASDPEVVDDEPSAEQKLDSSMGKLAEMQQRMHAMQQRQETMAGELTEVKALLKTLVDRSNP